MSKTIIKITEILLRSQKLPNSVVLLRESLESKKPLYTNKADNADKRLSSLRDPVHGSAKKPSTNRSIHHSRVSSQTNIKQFEDCSLKSKLDFANNRIESLSIELEYMSLNLDLSKPDMKVT